MTPLRITERAATRYTVLNGCWESTYSVTRTGYAQVGCRENGKSRMFLAHRAAWEYCHGPIGSGLTVDHVCKNRRCVNPAHMRLLSHFENAQRNQGDDWPLGGGCRHGHGETARVVVRSRQTKKGWKTECGVCRRERRAKYLARRKAVR